MCYCIIKGMTTGRYTVQDFNKQFPDNEACLRYLFTSRFGEPFCLACGQVNRYYLQRGSSHFVCVCGGHQLSPKKNTIFEKSDTDLYKWFYAIYLFSIAKNGVSAKELQRQLGVTYKCAWRIGKQIRQLFSSDCDDPLTGIVEADETYIGGRARVGDLKKVRGRNTEAKAPVVGAVERNGRVTARVIPDASVASIIPFLQSNVATGSILMTDRFKSYYNVSKLGYQHETINHQKNEFARGIVHTNTIEGFWSQLKRSVNGTYHAVSRKYLQTYLNEFSYRYSLRHSEQPVFSCLVSMACTPAQVV